MLFEFPLSSYFYDNGLVNIFVYLNKIFQEKKLNNENKILKSFEEFKILKSNLGEIFYEIKYKGNNLKLNLYPNKLIIDTPSEQILENFLLDIFKYLLIDSGNIYFTKNNEWRLNLETQSIEYVPKIDIKGKGSANDIKHPKNIFYKSINEIGNIKNIILNFYNGLSTKDKQNFWKRKKEFKEFDKIGIKFEKSKKFNGIEIELEPGKRVYIEKILIDFSLEDFTQSYLQYLFDKDKFKFDSKVHPFEDGQNRFEDLLKNKKELSKIDLIIWQLGQKGQRYFSVNYYFYLYASNLINLFGLKILLKISDKLDENKNTNFKLEGYIFPNEESFQILKIMIFLYNLLDDKTKKEAFLFKDPSILLYKAGDLKDTLLIFNKINLLFNLFNNWSIKTNSEFKKLLLYISNVVKNYHGSQDNLPEFKNIGYKLLNIIPFAKDIADLQEKNLSLPKRQRQFIPKDFYDLYSKFLIMIGENNNLHQISKVIGEKIGYFLAKSERGGEDMLFKLRNVKNKSQFLDWLSQVMFMILKEPEKQMSKTYESIENLLQIIDDTNFEDIKSYITIYSIQKYLSVKKASSN